jgi:hypothetical protein
VLPSYENAGKDVASTMLDAGCTSCPRWMYDGASANGESVKSWSPVKNRAFTTVREISERSDILLFTLQKNRVADGR